MSAARHCYWPALAALFAVGCVGGACGAFSAADNATPNDADAGDAGPDVTAPRKRLVFLTSESFRGDLKGYTAANEKCNELARAANISGDHLFVAFLAGNPALDAGSFSNADSGWFLLNGDKAFSKPPSFDGTTRPDAPIQIDQYGQGLDAGVKYAWTGADGKSCAVWTDAGAAFGAVGLASGNDETWILKADHGCDGYHHLYCFER